MPFPFLYFEIASLFRSIRRVDLFPLSSALKLRKMEKRQDGNFNETKKYEKIAAPVERSIPAPDSSIFSDARMHEGVVQYNETVLNSVRPEDRQRWQPYRHLFWNGVPSPVFHDYRQMFASNSGPARYYSNFQSNFASSMAISERRESTTTRLGLGSGNVVAETNFSTTETTLSPKKRKEKDKMTPLSREISESASYPWEIGGLNRPWVSTTSGPESRVGSSPNNDRTFTLCSYNVLCQQTLEETLYLYDGVPRQYLEWSYRWPLLQKEFSTLNADVYCLQEVEGRYYESCFLKFFQASGYNGLFKRRLGTKSDGCAIFWRTDRFDLLQSDSMDFQVADTILDRDNVALFVVLVPKIRFQQETTNGANVIIANTHLLFNPGRGDIKLCQLAMTLARVQKISRKNTNNAIILSGDFNAVPHSPLYNFLIEGSLHYVGLRRADVSGQERRSGPSLQYPLIPAQANIDEGTCQESKFDEDVVLIGEPGCLAHPLNFISAYSHLSTGGAPEMSTIHAKAGANVDYVFYNVKSKNVIWDQPKFALASSSTTEPKPQLRVKDFEEGRVISRSVLSLPGSAEIKKTVGALPNQFCASDHLPLMVKFEF